MLDFVANNFCELAEELAKYLLQSGEIEKEVERLYNHVEQAYISSRRGAVLDGHPKWCAHSHQWGAELYLYQNWPHGEIEDNVVLGMNTLIEQMKRDFLRSEGEQLSSVSIVEILQYLDEQYNYSEKVLNNGELVILSAGCSHRQFDALSRPRIYQDESFCCDIYLFHRQKDQCASLESILLHELGHVLNLSLTGDISTVPEDFFTFGEFFFPGLSTKYRIQAPEFFAHCFSMGAMANPEFQKFDAFPTIKLEHKRLFNAYMKVKIASLA